MPRDSAEPHSECLMCRAMAILPPWVQERLQESPFLTAAWVAPLLLGVFYYIGRGFAWVEKRHLEWVDQQNAAAATADAEKRR